MDVVIGDSGRPADAYPAEESNGSSQVHAFNNVDAEEQSSLSPPREQTSNEGEESAEHRRIKVIPNGSVVRIILNNRNSKGKAASYLGDEAVVVSSASNGMGGWHEVKTADGKLLKLQRNSLVIQKVGEQAQLADQVQDAELEYQERRPKQRRAILESGPEQSLRRPKRQATTRNAATHDAPEMATAFARNMSRDSVAKYARMYDIHPSGTNESWSRLLERCSQHYSRQKPMDSTDIPNLLISVHLALKRDRCRMKEPR